MSFGGAFFQVGYNNEWRATTTNNIKTTFIYQGNHLAGLDETWKKESSGCQSNLRRDLPA